MSATIQSLRELKEVLQQRMVESYEDVKDDQKLEEGQTYLKSYLIESDRKTFKESLLDSDKYIVRQNKTSETGFLDIEVKGGTSDKPSHFYLDKTDERFWTIHTLAKSTISDDFVQKLVFPRFTKLDFPWLSNNFLRDIGESPENTFRSFSLKFEDEFHEISDDQGVEGMSMRLWGETAKHVLGTLSQDEDLGSSTSLSNVGIRREFEEGRVLLEDIKHTAKFTARGDAVDGHFYQVNDVKSKYKNILLNLEEEYSISRGSTKSGGTISGSPVTIYFDRRITDLEEFFDIFLSSSAPFRLWGVRNKIEDDYYRVSAVDLHTGDEVDMEICPQWIRVYLPEGSCGNVILRLYTNIQHYFDSKAKLEGKEHGVIV